MYVFKPCCKYLCTLEIKSENEFEGLLKKLEKVCKKYVYADENSAYIEENRKINLYLNFKRKVRISSVYNLFVNPDSYKVIYISKTRNEKLCLKYIEVGSLM